MTRCGTDAAPAERLARQAPSLAGESASISPELFRKFQKLIYQEAGIWLAAHKTALLTGRLARRVRLLGLSSMLEYYRLATQADQQHERAVMIDCITTNETHFFREPRHFELLAQRIFPLWKEQAAAGQRPARIRIWSAGCSTGEEPFSLAMLLLKHFAEQPGWDLEILATDISTRVLEKARTATFPIERAKEIPRDYLLAYMLKGIHEEEGAMKACPELHKLVRFARVNLHADSYPVTGAFDLIFCRNVLIYFDQESKRKVVCGLLRHLAPSGMLFVGHSENLNGVAPGVRSIVPTVYVKPGSDGKLLPGLLASRADAGGRF
ncbi:MAG TPA: CheR family methyltransferase [Terriglobales bacterium]|jgi:chemotaxis protein methyltransferase CheR|nr:CheR family methyltransferase [Terriglobales bacterium]